MWTNAIGHAQSVPILAALDDSRASVQAGAFAVTLARATRSDLVFLTPSEPLHQGRVSEDRAAAWGRRDAAETLRELERTARRNGLRVERRLTRAGLVDATLAEMADGAAEALVVAYARGQRSEPAFGERAAQRVLQSATVPVVLVPPGYRHRWVGGPMRRILVPLGGAPSAERALSPAVSLAQAWGSEIVLGHVVSPSQGAARFSLTAAGMRELAARRYLDAIAYRIRCQGLITTTAVCSGFVGDGIAALARQDGADLVIMATRARHALARILLGSRTVQTLRHTPVPVMLLGPVASARFRYEAPSSADGAPCAWRNTGAAGLTAGIPPGRG